MKIKDVVYAVCKHQLPQCTGLGAAQLGAASQLKKSAALLSTFVNTLLALPCDVVACRASKGKRR